MDSLRVAFNAGFTKELDNSNISKEAFIGRAGRELGEAIMKDVPAEDIASSIDKASLGALLGGSGVGLGATAYGLSPYFVDSPEEQESERDLEDYLSGIIS